VKYARIDAQRREIPQPDMCEVPRFDRPAHTRALAGLQTDLLRRVLLRGPVDVKGALCISHEGSLMANLSKKSVFIVFGTALMGCSSMSAVLAAGCNPGGNCTVDVRVGENCAISVTPDTLDVPEPRGAKSITWTIVTDGYEFASNGIAFKSPNDEFEDPKLQGKKFSWKNRHTRAGDYAYSLNLVGSSPNPATCSLDPLIKNK